MFDLNPEQKRAVETMHGPVLIVAGAGSGKTKVITHRITHIMRTGIPASSILAITFTNKAAKEMKERVFRLIEEDKTLNNPISNQERPFVSTFHALGVHIIREHAGLLGLTRHFTIFDRSDSKRVIKDAMLTSNVDPKKFDPGMILNIISKSKGDGLNQKQYAERAKGFLEELVAGIWEKYEIALNKEKALDFDDLLLKTAELLEREEISKHYSEIWRYIHVDEYQDTNKVQYKITKLLAKEYKNLCVVGDADQNIYSWRGATIENIINFEKDYPDATVITLEQNYRSTKIILEAANLVIEKNTLRKKKVLFTKNDTGEKISLLVSYSEKDEARAIADIVRGNIEKGVEPKDMAVLYRANFQSRVLEESFINKNIPYQLIGVRYFERKEVKDIISYIRAALNRESTGDISRIINIPSRGIGKATIAKVLSNNKEGLSPAMQVKIANFYRLLDDIKQELASNKPSLAIKFVIRESGIEKMLREGDAEDEERLLNVQELVSLATQYDNLPGSEGIEAFLSNAALATDQDEVKEEKNTVKLMTVHASKGLEFEHVFVAGMEQDLFPFKHIDEDKMSVAEQEEERRLFYVAITRAKKKLYLSHSIIRTIYGAQRVSIPSEFIDDIEKNLIDDSRPDAPTGAKAIFIDF